MATGQRATETFLQSKSWRLDWEPSFLGVCECLCAGLTSGRCFCISACKEEQKKRGASRLDTDGSKVSNNRDVTCTWWARAPSGCVASGAAPANAANVSERTTTRRRTKTTQSAAKAGRRKKHSAVLFARCAALGCACASSPWKQRPAMTVFKTNETLNARHSVLAYRDRNMLACYMPLVYIRIILAA